MGYVFKLKTSQIQMPVRTSMYTLTHGFTVGRALDPLKQAWRWRIFGLTSNLDFYKAIALAIAISSNMENV